MAGYAVVDVETTGLFPGGHDRVVEVAVVRVDIDGQVEDSWTTLLNPGRDLGPQHIHRISAGDVVAAPTFAQIAGHLAGLLEGRVFVAHNASFDRRFVTAEFATLGWDVPVVDATSLCTMRWAGLLLPGAPRTLSGCCELAGIPHVGAHAALVDATATAALLHRYMVEAGLPDGPGVRPSSGLFGRVCPTWEAPWTDTLTLAETTAWPSIPVERFTPANRGASAEAVPFLQRLPDRLPRSASGWEQEQYLAVLDRALLDRVLSVREREALVAVAAELGVDRATAMDLHSAYLQALAVAAWADGVVTDAERSDLAEVGGLLGLGEADIDLALKAAEPGTGPLPAPSTTPSFALQPGDLVVFTGDMHLPRETWIARAGAAGLVSHSGVTKKVALVIAADPDSLSGKARKAADYGIPIVTEQAFARLLGDLMTRSAAL